MPKRNSGQTGAAIAWVKDFREREGRFPSTSETRKATGANTAACYEAVRRVRMEYSEPSPAPQFMRRAAVDFILDYHQKNGRMPTGPMVATAVNASLSTAQLALAEAKRKVGVQRKAQKATGTTAESKRQADILRVYNELVTAHPNATVNAIMVATASLLKISRQRVHQVLVFQKAS